jgi:ribosome biogenesis protein SSF1/2
MAGPLGITHFMIFSQTDRGTNLRICRCPHGPTLTFRVKEYSLIKDITAIQQRPRSAGPEFQHAPLVCSLFYFDSFIIFFSVSFHLYIYYFL